MTADAPVILAARLRMLGVLVIALGFSRGAEAQEKLIKLRTAELITQRESRTPAIQLQAVEPPARGLHLVQLTGPPQAEWRGELAALGVTLLWYVPEDAYVARLKGVSLEGLRTLPFVHWVGPYRPEYRVDPRIQWDRATQVQILLTRDTPTRDVAAAGRLLNRLEQVSKSRLGTVLKGWLAPRNLVALTGSESVLWIERAPEMRLLDEISTKIVAGDDGLSGTPATVHGLGFDGEGVVVAMADSGLDTGEASSMHPDVLGRVDALLYYGDLTDASDEHSHGTHAAGIVAGNGAMAETDETGARYGLGVAPGAHLIVQRIFDGLGNYQAPPSFAALTGDAVEAGAVIGSNSWGDDVQGRYDLSAAEFDALARDADPNTPGDQPYILEFSAGNAGPGPQTLASPAVAKNVIATGASQNDRLDLFIYSEGQEALADFSSRGPCEDGRIKPDLVAPGTWIASLKSTFATEENAWLPISANYLYQGGTSQAGPHVSGAAAVFVQFYRLTHDGATPSPALVKAALIHSASDLDDAYGSKPTPNMDEGWGRVDLPELVESAQRYEFLDQTVLLSTGRRYERRVVVSSADEPLKITLVYTDEPGFPGAIPALVNDLDLTVTGPDGRIYCGNQFVLGESVSGTGAADHLNNVEAVRLVEPTPGEYQIEIVARSVVADARQDTPEIDDQDFALVVSGSLPLPGVGVLFFDRGTYRTPGSIAMRLIDPDLTGGAEVAVRIASATEPEGEIVMLQSAGSGGVFTNGIALGTGAPVGDGVLQIGDGDLIEADYQDALPPAIRKATARADFTPPSLINVTVTNRFGRVIISWDSDEPSTSRVSYGTDSSLQATITSDRLEESHEMVLENLVVGQTYYLAVAGTDEAGNETVNDNNGQLFSFVAMPHNEVLLVDAYVHQLEYDGLEIPLTVYTDALDQIGVGYEVWRIDETGMPSPSLEDLQPFRVVIWRINDNFWDAIYRPGLSGLTGPQQAAIQSYLDGGGAFFMASMEILSRLGDVPFRREVFRVEEFVTKPPDDWSPCETCDEDHGVPLALGIDRDPISRGMALELDYSKFPVFELEPLAPNLGPDFSDVFSPSTNATKLFIEPATGKAAGMRYPRTGQDALGRVVFLSFPLEAVSEEATAPSNRLELLRNVLSFLAPGLGGVSTIALDRPAYTIPSRVTVEVADSDLAGQAQLNVQFTSDSSTNAVDVVLQETVSRGLFRGSVALANADTNVPPGSLAARGGDVIRVDYLDVSSGRAAWATADVDVVPPDVFWVTSVADYETAQVVFSTSEASDALVQYWESAAGFPNNRTAYQPNLTEEHSLTLFGLSPDRIYYFQVVARDAAGNATIDDNDGQFYQLRTLQPLVPPWSDDMEQGSAGWTVFDVEGTESSWQLGIPGPATGTTAYSPLNAWGSNLGGGPVGLAESFLISPAVDLTGGGQATLRFRHYYDFTSTSEFDILEGGELLVITNAVTPPVLLTTYVQDTSSDGWEEVEVDLTPHLGRVVFLVWHYVVASLEFQSPANRTGWLLDDVSLAVWTEPSGTLRVTNNLSQARFTISGPTNSLGQGWEMTLTNAPPGDYVVTFEPVPYYETPAPLTNSLVAEAEVVFGGFYRFSDNNDNAMADTWEQAWFGEVNPDRTPLTDTDADGAGDLAEFVAGTDPTDPQSQFEMSLPQIASDSGLHLEWSSRPGLSYRLEASEDLLHWVPIGSWIQASSDVTSVTIPSAQTETYQAFRLEVRP